MTLRIVCCDDMPSGVGQRIVHCLEMHRDELPPDLTTSVERMLEAFADACWCILADLQMTK